MKDFVRKYLRQIVTTIIFGVGVFMFYTLCGYVRRETGGDDIFYLTNTPMMSLFNWIGHRYSTWTGRISSESYEYLFNNISFEWWRRFNVFNYAVLLFFVYKIYKLLFPRLDLIKDSIAMLLVALLPLGMNFAGLVDASLWMTGSINYLWIAASGVAAMYPMLYIASKRKLPPVPYLIFGFIGMLIASLGQEQVIFIVLAVAAGAGVYWYRRVGLARSKELILLAAYLIVGVVGFIVNYGAPGNRFRTNSEIAARIPNFDTVGLFDKLNYTYRWFLDALINHTGMLMIVIWILLIVLLLRQKVTYRRVAVLSLLVLAATITLFRVDNGTLFQFYAQWGIAHFIRFSYEVVGFWTVVLAATLYGAYLAFDTKLKGLVYAGILLIALLSLALLTLSPTLYASGPRVVFVPSLLFGSIIIILARELMERVDRRLFILIVLLLVYIPIHNYSKLISIYDIDFAVHFPW